MIFASGGLALEMEIGPVMIGGIVLLFAASFFFSGTETAFFSLQKVDRDALAKDGRAGRLADWLAERPTQLITTILMGNELANTALAATSAALFLALAPSHAWWLNVVVLTPLLVLVSEITPKVLAKRFRRVWARVVAVPLGAFFLLVWPLRWVFTTLVKAIKRLLGLDTAGDAGDAEAELMAYVDRSAASGELDPMERDTIERVFEFDDTTVERLMTPRPDVFSVSLDIPWEDLVSGCREANRSRIPVTHGGEIIGVLLLKDLLKVRKAPVAGPKQLRALLMRPVFVPPTKSADAMLREFLQRRYHMAFVMDEHGTFVGLLTLDDLLAELFGELYDEEEAQPSEIRRSRPDALTVKGAMDVEDFSEDTGIELPEGDYHTVAGFVFHELGRLPRRGDTVKFEGMRFVVAAMEGRRISEVTVLGIGTRSLH